MLSASAEIDVELGYRDDVLLSPSVDEAARMLGTGILLRLLCRVWMAEMFLRPPGVLRSGDRMGSGGGGPTVELVLLGPDDG